MILRSRRGLLDTQKVGKRRMRKFGEVGALQEVFTAALEGMCEGAPIVRLMIY